MTVRDHGGALDAAMTRWGGTRDAWLDLSTGINPVPYPLPQVPAHAWTALPDAHATARLVEAARAHWSVPDECDILAAPGASALIARIPSLARPGRVDIPGPTYNEHAAAFRAQGWEISSDRPTARVVVHPNNPDGQLWDATALSAPLTVIDESFCDVCPDASLVSTAGRPGTLVLKSFGKFWGLAGLRLGFAIGDPALVAALREALGPWPVSGPALHIGAAALGDTAWAEATCARLVRDAATLDRLMTEAGAALVGGTSLFRLYDVGSADVWHDHLARHHILTRTFPYAPGWLRLGLPAPEDFARLAAALADRP